MRLFMNHLTIEKNFCVFLKNNTDYLGNENYFLENVNNTRIDDQSFSKKLNFPKNYFNKVTLPLKGGKLKLLPLMFST